MELYIVPRKMFYNVRFCILKAFDKKKIKKIKEIKIKTKRENFWVCDYVVTFLSRKTSLCGIFMTNACSNILTQWFLGFRKFMR